MGNQPNEGGAQKEPAVGLKRTLGLREAITITAGTVIGVGLFTTGGNVVGEMGPLPEGCVVFVQYFLPFRRSH